MKYYVYIFKDPVTEEVRYVDYSSCKRNYCYSLSRFKRSNNPWMQYLLSQDLVPTFHILFKDLSLLEAIEKSKAAQELYKEKGYKIEDSLFPIKGGHNKGQTKVDLQKLKQLYVDEKKTLDEVQKALGASRETIRLLIKSNGWKRDIRAKYCINHQYFNQIDSAEKAYIVGLLATDGCLYRSEETSQIILELQLGDQEILEKCKERLEYTGPLIIRTNKKSATLQFTSTEIFNNLVSIGVGPKKSLTIGALNISEQYNSHLLRGIMDGDGSIILYGKKRATVMFASASRNFIEYIEGIVKKVLPDTNVQVYLDKTVFRLDIGGSVSPHCQVMKLLDYIYRDSTLHLNRKYQKYLELKKLAAADDSTFKEKVQKQKGHKIVRVDDGKIYPSIKEAAREVGSTVSNIRNVLLGKHSHSKGYKWAYFKE